VIFGAATAAYQIEGAWDDDGKGRSIWDEFVRRPGAIANADTGDVACDHYHRWREDVELMGELGLQAYRFSVSWPRVLPEGTGRVEQRGLDFYDRLVDGLLERGIEPWVTLYHWDLPLALQERGGWQAPDAPGWFADYATMVVERLGDRVRNWITLNEPWVAAFEGYAIGNHAPGLRDPQAGARAAHELMRAHHRAVPVIRAAARAPRVGIALNLSPVEPASQAEADVEAARRVDGWINRWFLDATFGRGYPSDIADWFGFEDTLDETADVDFVGVNYYFRSLVCAADNLIGGEQVPVPGAETSDMGWEVYPRGLSQILARIREEYAAPSVAVTENGIALQGVDDQRRIAYLRDHIAEADALAEAYFVWSLLDNFEWAWGYAMRFGLVHVDYATQTRTIKASGRWYADVIRAQAGNVGE
jgi:beta-glucosidase